MNSSRITSRENQKKKKKKEKKKDVFTVCNCSVGPMPKTQTLKHSKTSKPNGYSVWLALSKDFCE